MCENKLLIHTYNFVILLRCQLRAVVRIRIPNVSPSGEGGQVSIYHLRFPGVRVRPCSRSIGSTVSRVLLSPIPRMLPANAGHLRI